MLKLESLSKTFGGTRALQDVSLEIFEDEILAIVGSNGSGKSTLIKTLAGYHKPDPGARAWFGGEQFDMTAVTDERRTRLHFVHQDLGLVLELGVMDNLALRHRFARRWLGQIHWREQEQITYELLERFDFDVDIHRPLSELTPVERVIVAIVAALQSWESGGRGVLVLDEPTAVLPPNEVARLFEIVAEIRRGGSSVVYVSHRLDEIFEIANRVAVLRGGRLIAVEAIRKLTVPDLAALMVGEDVDPYYRVQVSVPCDAPVALQARDIFGTYLRGASFEVRRGEIVGLAGLPGSGREELPYVLAGALGDGVDGALRLPARTDGWLHARDAAMLRLPIVPADRGREGIIGELSVRENFSLSVLDRVRRRVVVDRSRERALVDEWIDRLQIRTDGSDAPISTLSGGNQQKVVIARSLALEPPVLLLCEPTAGVDIATRIAIYDLVANLVCEGLAVVVSSTDMGDLLALCTRVVVFAGGRPVDEISQKQLTERVLLRAMEGAPGT